MRATKIAVRHEYTGTVVGERIQRQAQDAAGVLRRCPFVEGRMKSLRLEAGVPLVVDHGLGAPAAFIVARQNYDPKRDAVADAEADGTWITRAWAGDSMATLAAGAGNFTTGAGFVLARPRLISGVRFLWKDAGALTIRAKLWGASAELARADVAVSGTGVYVATFAAPVLAPAGVQLFATIYETTGAKYVHASEATTTFLSGDFVFGDVTKGAANCFAAGDAKPTGNAATEIYWVEPVLRPLGGPRIEEHPDQTGIDAKHQIRVVADRDALVDVWIYPRASATINASKGQSE